MEGFYLGFFTAEGNYIYYKHQLIENSIYSEYALKRWSKEKGYSNVDEYLKKRKKVKIRGIQLTCGIKDIERGYREKLQYRFNMNHYNNIVHLTSYDKELIALTQRYIGGTTSKTKYLKDTVFNRSVSFLKGILEGFIAGDGHEERTRTTIGITENYRLRDNLMIICKILGLETRYGENMVHLKINNKSYKTIKLRILKGKNRIIRKDIIYYRTRYVDEYILERLYELELESRLLDSEDYWNRILVLSNGTLILSQ